MKKTALFAVCVLPFFGGLFCLHIIAQPENRGLFSARSTSLLDLKIEETSERELLELKVAVRRKQVDAAVLAYEAQSPSGTATRLMETHANLAAAEAELYRHTGEQDKLLAALKEKAEALTDKLQAATYSFELGVVPPTVFHEMELQLLDALLELKRAGEPQKEK